MPVRLSNADFLYLREHYEKKEYRIRMRDGITLHTLVYQPKDKSRPWPNLLNHTCSTFKEGHCIMFQVRSAWFPFIDRNPQYYVENIYKAEEKDFIKATISVVGSSEIGVGGAQQGEKPF